MKTDNYIILHMPKQIPVFLLYTCSTGQGLASPTQYDMGHSLGIASWYTYPFGHFFTFIVSLHPQQFEESTLAQTFPETISFPDNGISIFTSNYANVIS